MEKIKRFAKKCYFKISPTYRALKKIIEVLFDMKNQIDNIWEEMEIIRNNQKINSNYYIDLDKYTMLSEIITYRYAYITKYIKSGCRVLDVEAEYGAGANLLSKISPVSKVNCLNSIREYANRGKIYYEDEIVGFSTGTIYDISGHYDIVLLLNSYRNVVIDKFYIERLYTITEKNGYVIICLCDTSNKYDGLFTDRGFYIEEKKYQSDDIAEFTSYSPRHAIIYVLKKC